MNQISCIVMAVLALCYVIHCKDLRSDDNTLCSEIDCLNTKDIVRSKRDAASIIGSVGNLVTGFKLERN
ncbi:hypothetical protein KGM_208142 [Danaus plexippus plexippus]|uniref:Uncharacterized protein n=1 Tax=Danaus plexippus plexippus TaxID=278856 RepID=A0A212EZP7_DANPL|nr:hypothetical protein KGM_208142 [Danaus plexippus plexippus]